MHGERCLALIYSSQHQEDFSPKSQVLPDSRLWDVGILQPKHTISTEAITYVFNDNSKEIFPLRKMTTKQDLHDVVCRVVIRNGLRVIKAWDLIFM